MPLRKIVAKLDREVRCLIDTVGWKWHVEELGVGMVVCKVNEQRMWMGTTTELDCRTIADRKRVDSAIGCCCSCCDHVRGCSVLLCLCRDPSIVVAIMVI